MTYSFQKDALTQLEETLFLEFQNDEMVFEGYLKVDWRKEQFINPENILGLKVVRDSKGIIDWVSIFKGHY